MSKLNLRYRDYAFAVFTVLVALLLNVGSGLATENPFLFSVAVVASAAYGGLGTGILATVLLGVGLALQGHSLAWEFVLEGGVMSCLIAFLPLTKQPSNYQPALERSEEQFRQIAKNTDLIVWIADLDLKEIFYVSPQYESVWGRSRESLYAQPISFLESIHPEDRDRIIDAFEERVQGTYDREYRIIQPDGAIRWIRDRAFPIRKPTGEVYRVAGVTEDITKRRQVETSLRESEARFRQLVEVNLIGVGFGDPTGKITEANDAFLSTVGYTRAEMLLGQISWPDMTPNEYQEIDEKAIAQLKTTGVCSPYEKEYIRKDGTRVPILISAAFLDSENKREVVCCILNLSEHHQQQAQLQRANERFRLATSAVKCIIYDWDLQNNTVERIQGLTDLLGFKPEEVNPNSIDWWMERIHPEDREQCNRIGFAAISNPNISSYDIEYRVRNAQNEYIPVSDRGFIARQDGIAVRVVGCTLDLSQTKQAEAQLRQSEERFRTAVENMLDCFGIFSSIRNESGQIIDFRIEYVNPAACVNNRLTAEEQIGKQMCDLFPGMRDSDLLEGYIQVAATRQPLSKENVLYSENSSGNPQISGAYDFRIAPFGDGIIITWRNITERRQAEAELYLREQEFKALVENSPDKIARFSRDLRFVYVNPVIETLTGLPVEAHIGKTHLELGFLEEKYRVWQEALERAFTTQQQQILDFELQTPTGITKFFQARIVPEFAPDGSLTTVLAVTRDVTDFKRVETALRDSETKFRRLVESNVIGCMFWETSGRIVDANDAFLEMVGYSREEMEAGLVRWLDMTPPEQRETSQKAIAQMKKTGAAPPLEKEYIAKDGRRIPILLGGVMFENSQERGVSIVLDLTERKLAERERAELLQREKAARRTAEAASRAKDEFLAIVSHELRSPLNAMLGWSRLLRTRKLAEDKANKALETIERNAQAQSQLIEDLLDISRIIQGKTRLYPRPLNLVDVVEAAINTVRPSADTKSISLQLYLDPQVRVSGDPDRLQQVVWNLLSNAVKFTPMQGNITIRLETVGDCGQIRVSDSGIGINPDFLPHVFERFRQAESSTTRTSGGLGLGLAIVRNLVELHGGTIAVESAGINQGTTFIVQLPLIFDLSDRSLTDDPPQDSFNIAGVKVLLVDDEADTREFLTVALEQSGAIVATAASVKEAIALLDSFHPDVLLSDIGMPLEDGYTLIHQIRQSPQWRQLPAAALTAYAREEDRQQALNAGFQLHVSKPIEPMQLISVVAKLKQMSKLLA